MNTPFFPALRPVLAPMGSRTRAAARGLRQATLSQLEQSLAPALAPDRLQKPARGGHSRVRIFDLTSTFWGWIWQIFQANTSCREVVLQMQAMFCVLEQSPPEEGNSAYCQARAKLTMDRLELALADSFQSAEKATAGGALLQGRPLKVADGSCIRLEDTPPNRQAFPPATNQFARPSFPLLKAVVLLSLRSGALLARAIGTLKTTETRLLLGLGQHLHGGDILISDRAFGQFVVAHWVQSLGADLLARLNVLSRKVDFRKASQRLGPKDALFVWQKPKIPSALLTPEQWAEVPATLTVRILHRTISRPGFRTRELTLVTTLLDPELYPADELFQAYAKRWRLEMCFDDLKTTLGMEQLHCKSPSQVQKELLIFFIAHNFIRWIMAQAARAQDVDLERLSFKGTLDAFRQWSHALTQVRGPGKPRKRRRIWLTLLKILAADLVPFRPGRQEPRAVKKRSKIWYLQFLSPYNFFPII